MYDLLIFYLFLIIFRLVADSIETTETTPWNDVDEDRTTVTDLPTEEPVEEEEPHTPEDVEPIEEVPVTTTENTPDYTPESVPTGTNCRGDDKAVCPRNPNHELCSVQFCDGEINCPDGEDEENCDGC